MNNHNNKQGSPHKEEKCEEHGTVISTTNFKVCEKCLKSTPKENKCCDECFGQRRGDYYRSECNNLTCPCHTPKEGAYYETMGAVNKLSDYKVRYRCFDDCKQQGCPTHIAKFSYGSTSETFCVEFDGVSSCYDSVQFRLIKEFIKKLEE